jgi:hypothetical protein
MATIGQMVGVIVHTFTVKNDAGDKVQITAKYDLTKAPDEVIRAWLASDRTIAYQRVLRTKTAEEIKSLNGEIVVYDGSRAKVQIDPETAMVAKLQAMTPEEQVTYLKELAAKASR